jgi:uncharacterized membrane protein YqhA
MTWILEKARYLVLLAVFSCLLAAAAAFGWGAWKTFAVITDLLRGGSESTRVTVSLIELMDKFLIAAGLYIFAVGLYELFIADLALPEWLTVHTLHEVKSRISSVVILVLAIVFLEHFVEWQDPRGTLLFGIAATLVTGALIAFSHFGKHEPD